MRARTARHALRMLKRAATAPLLDARPRAASTAAAGSRRSCGGTLRAAASRRSCTDLLSSAPVRAAHILYLTRTASLQCDKLSEWPSVMAGMCTQAAARSACGPQSRKMIVILIRGGVPTKVPKSEFVVTVFCHHRAHCLHKNRIR